MNLNSRIVIGGIILFVFIFMGMALPWNSSASAAGSGGDPEGPVRAAQLHIVTYRNDPADAEITSHRLMARAGYILVDFWVRRRGGCNPSTSRPGTPEDIR